MNQNKQRTTKHKKMWVEKTHTKQTQIKQNYKKTNIKNNG